MSDRRKPGMAPASYGEENRARSLGEAVIHSRRRPKGNGGRKVGPSRPRHVPGVYEIDVPCVVRVRLWAKGVQRARTEAAYAATLFGPWGQRLPDGRGTLLLGPRGSGRVSERSLPVHDVQPDPVRSTGMPLIKRPGRKAIGENIATEEAAGRPRKQALAIALETDRRAGGKTPPPPKSTKRGRVK